MCESFDPSILGHGFATLLLPEGRECQTEERLFAFHSLAMFEKLPPVVWCSNYFVE